MKNMLTPELLCAESEEGQRLIPFLKEIFDLDFDQKPNYDKLRFTLVRGLLNLNETPNKEYDWNADYLASQKKPQQIGKNMSCESMDMCAQNTDETSDRLSNGNSNAVDYDMNGSDSLCASNSGFNLNSKMVEMQGYQFIHNVNHQAMQKIIDQK